MTTYHALHSSGRRLVAQGYSCFSATLCLKATLSRVPVPLPDKVELCSVIRLMLLDDTIDAEGVSQNWHVERKEFFAPAKSNKN